MENFLVSARKYRPQNFESVVGQSHITTTLKNAINHQQLAHAFLFCGPRGVGKTTCARILAKTINCENRTESGEACNECASCVSFNRGSSMNIHELDAASNNSVEDIRNLVDQVRFAPQAGKYKVYIVDEVHMLSSAAFNAFLKTLEEPPSYAIFILATTEKHKIIPTILSRCQIFDFKRIQTGDTVDHLTSICTKENIEAEQPALHLIAQKSEGCLRDSLSLLDKIVSFTNGRLTYSNTLEHLNILDEEYFFRLMESMQKQDVSEVLYIYHEINAKGFEGDQVLNSFSEFLRNVLVSRDPKVAALLEVAENFKSRFKTVAATVDANWVLSALNILNESEVRYQQAKNKRLHVELALIKLAFLQQVITFSDDSPQIAKKKSINDVKPVMFKALSPVLHGDQSKQARVKVQANDTGSAPANGRLTTAAQTAAAQTAAAHTTGTTHGSAARAATHDAAAETTTAQATAATVTVRKERKATNVRSVVSEPKPRVSSLSLKKIRQRVEEENIRNKVLPLNLAGLQECWEAFTLELANRNNHSGAANFRTAKLEVLDDKKFKVIVDSSLHGRFIENEKMELVSNIREHFNNRLITFETEIVETVPSEPVVRITNREQLDIMKSNFPLVATLMENLELKLDNL